MRNHEGHAAQARGAGIVRLMQRGVDAQRSTSKCMPLYYTETDARVIAAPPASASGVVRSGLGEGHKAISIAAP